MSKKKYIDSVVCLMCGEPLPKVISNTGGVHHYTCPYGYYIPCSKCGHKNGLSELLDFSAGCNAICEQLKDIVAPQITR